MERCLHGKKMMNEINGWESLFRNETIIKTRDPHKNVLSTNMKEVEPYD
jgi:hypothetical protein